MSWLELLTLVGIAVVVVLVVYYLKRHASDQIDSMIKSRTSSSRLTDRAQYVEGIEAIPVALALTDTAIFYENPDFQANFELDRIDEVEYVDELSTGKELDGEQKVMRLRSHGQTFEFILPKGRVTDWAEQLPPHRADEPGRVKAF